MSSTPMTANSFGSNEVKNETNTSLGDRSVGRVGINKDVHTVNVNNETNASLVDRSVGRVGVNVNKEVNAVNHGTNSIRSVGTDNSGSAIFSRTTQQTIQTNAIGGPFYASEVIESQRSSRPVNMGESLDDGTFLLECSEKKNLSPVIMVQRETL